MHITLKILIVKPGQFSLKIWVSFIDKNRSVILTFGVHFDINIAEKHSKGNAAKDSQYLKIAFFIRKCYN